MFKNRKIEELEKRIEELEGGMFFAMTKLAMLEVKKADREPSKEADIESSKEKGQVKAKVKISDKRVKKPKCEVKDVKTETKHALKAGDKVRVKNDLRIGGEYHGVYFIRDMAKFRGKIVTIWSKLGNVETFGNRYYIEEDADNWVWSEEMFESVEPAKKNSYSKEYYQKNKERILAQQKLYKIRKKEQKEKEVKKNGNK